MPSIATSANVPSLAAWAPAKAVEPEELFWQLQPFKELVADDIRDDGGDEQ